MATRTIVASGANGTTTFSSPALWEASLPATLTEIEIGEQEDFNSTGVVTFAGPTTTASFYIHYRAKAGDEHLGYNAGGGAKIIDDGSNDGVVRLAVGHIRVSNIIVESTGNRFGFVDAGNNIVDARIYNNIVYSSAATSSGRGINCASAGGTFRVYNNAVYDYGGAGAVGYGIAVANSTCSVLASNNTVYGCRYNFVIISGSMTPKNNISDSPRGGDCYLGTFTSPETNLSSDATSPNTTLRSKNPVYVGEGSVGSRDLRLASTDTDCQGVGTDLSSGDPAITVDFVGTTRANPPDLGAFEYVAASSGASTTAFGSQRGSGVAVTRKSSSRSAVGSQKGKGTSSGATARSTSSVGTSRGVGVCSSKKTIITAVFVDHRGSSTAQAVKSSSSSVAGSQNGQGQTITVRNSSSSCVGKQRGSGTSSGSRAITTSVAGTNRGSGYGISRKSVTISSVALQKGKATVLSAKNRTTSTSGSQRGSSFASGTGFIPGISQAYGTHRGGASASSRKSFSASISGTQKGCGVSTGRKSLTTSITSPQKGKAIAVSVKLSTTQAFGWQNGIALASGSKSGSATIGTQRGGSAATSRKGASLPAVGVQRGVGRSVSLKVLLTIAIGSQRGLGRASSISSENIDVVYDLTADCEYSSDVAVDGQYTSDIFSDGVA